MSDAFRPFPRDRGGRPAGWTATSDRPVVLRVQEVYDPLQVGERGELHGDLALLLPQVDLHACFETIRESGGDRSAVTGGTQVLSDWIRVRITAAPGTTFLDRMIKLVEGAERQKTPNEIALNVLLAGLTLIFLIAAPEGGGSEHMKILAALARRLIRQDFKDRLHAASDPAEVTVESLDDGDAIFIEIAHEVIDEKKRWRDAKKDVPHLLCDHIKLRRRELKLLPDGLIHRFVVWVGNRLFQNGW